MIETKTFTLPLSYKDDLLQNKKKEKKLSNMKKTKRNKKKDKRYLCHIQVTERKKKKKRNLALSSLIHFLLPGERKGEKREESKKSARPHSIKTKRQQIKYPAPCFSN